MPGEDGEEVRVDAEHNSRASKLEDSKANGQNAEHSAAESHGEEV